MFDILNQPTVWNNVVDGYSKYTQEPLGKLNEKALAKLKISPNFHVLDIACGPGTACISLSNKVKHIDAIDFSPKMVSKLNEVISRKEIKNIVSVEGDGQKLPFKEESYDLIYSFFGLMFFPDRAKGFKEISRVLKADGVAIVSSWPSPKNSSAMRALGESIKFALGSNLDTSKNEPKPILQCKEDYLFEISNTGIELFDFRKININFDVESASDYFNNSVNGAAPMLHMKNNMETNCWKKVEQKAIEYLEQNYNFPNTFNMVANYAYLKKINSSS